MDSFRTDSHLDIPISLSESVTSSTKKTFPAFFAGPIISLLAAVATARAEDIVEGISIFMKIIYFNLCFIFSTFDE